MYDQGSFFTKKNIINLLLLGIVVMGIPLATNLLKYQQILRARADNADIRFDGANIKTVGAKKFATSTTVDLKIFGKFANQGNTTQTSSISDKEAVNLAQAGWVDQASADHLGTDGAEPCGQSDQRSIGGQWDNCYAHWAYIDENGQDWCVKDNCQSGPAPVEERNYCASGNQIWHRFSDGREEFQHQCSGSETCYESGTDAGCRANQTTQERNYCASGNQIWHRFSDGREEFQHQCSGSETCYESGTDAGCRANSGGTDGGNNSGGNNGGGSQGSCSLNDPSVSGNTVSGTISSMAGRDHTVWTVLNGDGSINWSGTNTGTAASKSGLNNGSYKLKAEVYCQSCGQGPITCGEKSFTINVGGGQNGGNSGGCFVCSNKKWRLDGNGCPTDYTAPVCNPATNTPVPGKAGKFNWDGCTGATDGGECDTGGSSSNQTNNNTTNNQNNNTTTGTPYTQWYKIAFSEAGLASAQSVPYTTHPMVLTSFQLDTDPNFRGTKTIWVEFKYSNSNTTEKKSATIEVIGPEPTITSCTASVALSGSGVNIRIRGNDFGPANAKGKVISGDNGPELRASSWSNNEIVASIDNIASADTGTVVPLSIIRSADASKVSVSELCKVGVSQLALSAGWVCGTNKAIGQADVIITDSSPSAAQVHKEKISVDKSGVMQNVKAKLQHDSFYRLCVKVSGSVRRCTEFFKASEGTTVIPKLSIPVGDINGDGCINSLDKTQMNREWNEAARASDLNGDGKTNSIDWVCMKKDFGQCDSSEPKAADVTTTACTSESNCTNGFYCDNQINACVKKL